MGKYIDEQPAGYVEGVKNTLLYVASVETCYTNGSIYQGVELYFYGLMDGMYQDQTVTLTVPEAQEAIKILTRMTEIAKKYDTKKEGNNELHFRVNDELRFCMVIFDRTVAVGISGGNTVCYFRPRQLSEVKDLIGKATINLTIK